MGRLKAASIINNIAIVRELLGEPRLAELLRPLPAVTQALFARRVLAVEWIEADEWLVFQQAMLDTHYGGDELRMRQYMHKVCERDFTTFYKIVLKLASAQTVLSRAPKIWQTYAEPGELRIARLHDLDAGVRETNIELLNFETQHTVFAVLVQAFVEQLLKMTGAREIVVERQRLELKNGKLAADYRARFRE